MQRRNNDGGFSTKAVALKLVLSAAAIGTVTNLWLLQSYSKDDIYLTHHDVDDEVQPEWEPILDYNSPSSDKATEPSIDDKLKAFLVNEHSVDDKAAEPSVDDETTTSVDDKNTLEQRSQLSDSTRSCFKARNNTVPEHLYGKLQKPYLNLGFPKMGTSSLHNFFNCGGLKSVHYRCNRVDSCARCMKESVEAGGKPLDLCIDTEPIDMYAQMDDGNSYFPQIELLDELVAGYPTATLFLTFRPTEKWYNSLKNWPPRKNGPHMNRKIRDANITGLPSGVGNYEGEFADWFCKHVERVRDIVARNPSLTLVEVDIEDSTIAERMSDTFEIDESCWGHTNVNPMAHPDLDLSDVQVAKKFFEIAKKKALENTAATT